MSKKVSVKWTLQALGNVKEIASYINNHFSSSEIDRFYSLLSDFEKAVANFPELYPASKKHPNIRKAIIHKNTSVIYHFSGKEVTVLAVFDNRQLHEY